MLSTSLRKKRLIGLLLFAVILTLFFAFNRFPKLETVGGDLEAVTAPQVQCFQGFCIEREPGTSFLGRWLVFSVTYLRLVTVGMIFAFLVAGLTEAFLFPSGSGRGFSSGSVFKRTVKGLAVGPVMNLCSACIVPVSAAFQRRGGGIEGAIAMVQGSATMNIPALAMVFFVFTPLLGFSRLVLAVIGALVIGPIVVLAVRRGRGEAQVQPEAPQTYGPQDNSEWRPVMTEAFRDWAKTSFGYLIRIGPIMVVAGFASGLAIQWISPETVSTYLGNDVLGVAIAATFGIMINVPLLFEIPLVALLLLLGMGTAPAATLLFTAAAGGPITFWGLARVMPKRAIAVFATATWVLGAIGGLGILGIGAFIWDEGLPLRAAVAEASGASPDAAPAASLQLLESGEFDKTIDEFKNAAEPTWASNPNASSMRFTDVTKQAGITYRYLPPEPLFGRPEPAEMTGGAVAEDFNGDGWVDLFVLRGGIAPSYLYINQGDGTFTEEAEARNADLPAVLGAGAAAADFDNDGDLDIVVASHSAPHYLLLNDRAGYFTIDNTMLTEPEFFATSPSWGDVDNDGLLELVLGEWNMERADAQIGSSNVKDAPANGVNESTPVMYRNTGNGQLEIYEFRLMPLIDWWVLAPRFADLNGDRLTDLAVAADFGRSRLYLNVGDGMFDTVSVRLTDENGMGAAIGDYDNDGDLDWFVSSVFDDLSSTLEVRAFHGVTGNRLYRNEGGMTFTDVTGGAGVRDGGWGWGASFGDLDNDGDLDLYHVNGWVQNPAAGDPRLFDEQPSRLFSNLGDGTFEEVAGFAGAANRGQGRGVILFDFDNDGDLDIFITNNHKYIFDYRMASRDPGTPVLLRNDSQNENHWLKVTLDGTPPLHRDGIGSRVYVTTGGITQMRELHASTNFMTQEPGRIAHFGLGTATIIDEVRAEWVNGEVNILTNVAVDQHISLSSR